MTDIGRADVSVMLPRVAAICSLNGPPCVPVLQDQGAAIEHPRCADA
jgi:hypothetical protein